MESFRSCQIDHAATDTRQPGARDTLHGDLPDEISGGQSSADTRRTSRRQHVIRADRVVTGDLRRPTADEQRAHAFDLRRRRFIVDDHVFGRCGVSERDRFGLRPRHDDAAMSLHRQASRAIGRHSSRDFRGDLRRELAVGCDENCARIGIVLGLCDQIGRDPGRVAVRRQQQNLARAGVEVDSTVRGDERLRRRDPAIAGPDDLVHARHRFRSVCERGNRMRTTKPEQSGDARFDCGCHHDRLRSRAHRHDVTHAGGDGGDSGHQQR